MTPSPFEVGRAVGNQIGGAMQRYSDRTALDDILENANRSNNPNAINDAMTQILSRVSPERQQMAIAVLQQKQKLIQDKLDKENALKQAQTQISQIEKSRNLPTGSLGGVGSNVKLAEQLSRPEKGYRPTQASQPIAPDQLQKIQDVRDRPEYEKASAPKKYQMLTDAGVSRENSKAEVDIFAEEEKNQKEERLAFHKESDKYDEELINNIRTAKKQIAAVEDIDKAIQSNNVKPGSISNIFKGMGPLGDKISEAFLNNDQATLQAAIPQLLEGWKQVFGVRLTDADLRLLQDKLPSIGKSMDANRAVTKILKKYSQLTLLRGDIAKQIKDANGGLRPLGYANMIEERYDEMTAPVMIINPNNGKVIEIPAYKLSDAIKSGAKLANE